MWLCKGISYGKIWENTLPMVNGAPRQDGKEIDLKNTEKPLPFTPKYMGEEIIFSYYFM